VEYQRDKTVYVIKMGNRVTKEDLVMATAAHGRVNAIVFLEPPNKAPYAIVSFETREGYESAMTDGLTIHHRNVPVTQYRPNGFR
jgi:hypothetical protein